MTATEVKRRRASAVCEAEGQLLVVRLRDPVSGVTGAYPPGGGIEEGELPAVAAARETLEETGLGVLIDRESEVVARYPFVWNGVAYDVTTHFFAATLEAPFNPVLPSVVDAPYNLGAIWLPVEDALDALVPAIAGPMRDVLRTARRGR